MAARVQSGNLFLKKFLKMQIIGPQSILTIQHGKASSNKIRLVRYA